MSAPVIGYVFHLISNASIKKNEPAINIVLKINEWISSCNASPFQVLRPHPSSNNVDHINRKAAVNFKFFSKIMERTVLNSLQ